MAIFRTESPPPHGLGWTAEQSTQCGRSQQNPSIAQGCAGWLSFQVPAHPTSTWESCDRQEHQSCGQKFPAGLAAPVSSLGGVSPDPGTRRELDARPLGCACAGVRGPHGRASPRLAGLVLLGPLHSESCVRGRWLPLGAPEGLLLAALLGPGACLGGGSQAASPGQRVQAWGTQGAVSVAVAPDLSELLGWTSACLRHEVPSRVRVP